MIVDITFAEYRMSDGIGLIIVHRNWIVTTLINYEEQEEWQT